MDMKTAETIIMYQESGDLELYEDYSGRGMYGETTCGIVFDNIGELLAAVAEAMLNEPENIDVHSLARVRIDSMGRGSIIY